MPLRAPIQGRPGAPPAGQTPSQGLWELHRSMPWPGGNVPRPYGCEIEGGTGSSGLSSGLMRGGAKQREERATGATETQQPTSPPALPSRHALLAEACERQHAHHIRILCGWLWSRF